MTLFDWLLSDNDCNDEQRAEWAVQLAQLLPQCKDGHLNPERIDVDETGNALSLNDSSTVLDEYSAPELLKDDEARSFSTAVFSYGLIIDALYRNASFFAEKNWSIEEILRQTEGDWFEPLDEDDPLADVLRACLSDSQSRPKTPDELKAVLLNNADIAQIIKNNPQHPWATESGEDFAQTDATNSDDDSTQDEVDTGLAIGIDLGTSNSTVAYYQSGRYHYLELRSGKRLIPSTIYFKEKAQDKWIFGDSALKRGVMYPDALFKHFKRHIGKSEPQTFHVEPQGKPSTQIKRKYIIDTNIFIKDPRILEGFGDDVEILIPKIVFEELKRLQSAKDTEDEAEVALQSIDEHENIVSFEDSHPELLTDDMFQSSDRNNNDRNDSKILSVAFFHDSSKTILLSDDKFIAQKAEWKEHKFQVQNYETFSHYRHVTEESDTPDELKLTGKDGAAFFLQYLRNEIRKKIGYVNKAVITVPQEFSAIQHNEIKEAGFKAGFTEIELQKEPMAAAVAYGLELNENQIILVYDFGGGTFDVTILRISDGEFTRLASGGDDKLGGEDFTQALIDDFKDKLTGDELLSDDETLDMFDEENSGLSHEEFIKNELKIWEACEDMKCRLSVSDSDRKTVQLYIRPGERKDVEYELSRKDFEHITAELMVKAKKALDSTLKKAGLERGDIDVVILAGGTSSIPTIAETVEQYFGKKPYADRDPSTLIAEGAALFADLKWNQNSTIDKKIQVFDKTMTDFGVALKGRRFDVIIPVNSSLPMQKEKIYSLVEDEQKELLIECFTRDEGSSATRTMDDKIKYIGKVQISNLPPLKRSEVDVCVTFNLTKEYELVVDVNLKDKQGQALNQATVKINTTGI